MAQFTVYKNKNPRSKTIYPLLVDAQADLLDELQTRLVIPLTKAPALAKKPIARLTPSIEFDGEHYVLMTPPIGWYCALGTRACDRQCRRTTNSDCFGVGFADYRCVATAARICSTAPWRNCAGSGRSVGRSNSWFSRTVRAGPPSRRGRTRNNCTAHSRTADTSAGLPR